MRDYALILPIVAVASLYLSRVLNIPLIVLLRLTQAATKREENVRILLNQMVRHPGKTVGIVLTIQAIDVIVVFLRVIAVISMIAWVIILITDIVR